MVLLRLYCNGMDVLTLFLQKRCSASYCTSCSAARKKVSEGPACLLPDLRAGALIMRQEIGVVIILVWHIVNVRPWLRNGLCKRDALVRASAYSGTQIVRRFMQSRSQIA